MALQLEDPGWWLRHSVSEDSTLTVEHVTDILKPDNAHSHYAYFSEGARNVSPGPDSDEGSPIIHRSLSRSASGSNLKAAGSKGKSRRNRSRTPREGSVPPGAEGEATLPAEAGQRKTFNRSVSDMSGTLGTKGQGRHSRKISYSGLKPLEYFNQERTSTFLTNDSVQPSIFFSRTDLPPSATEKSGTFSWI